MTLGQKAPTVRQRGKQIIEINNIMGKVSRLSCESPAICRGRIIKRNFENDGITITGFILSDTRGRKHEVNFNRKQIKLLGQYSVNNVSTLLTTDKRVRVSTWISIQNNERKLEKISNYLGYAVSTGLLFIYVSVTEADLITVILATIFFSLVAVFISGLFKKSSNIHLYQPDDFERTKEIILKRADSLSISSETAGQITFFVTIHNRPLGVVGYFKKKDLYEIWIAGDQNFISNIENYIEKVDGEFSADF